MALNSVVLLGRLVKAPEVKQTQSGVSVCSFAVAVDRDYKSGEERQADFIDCVAWRSSADFVGKYFDRGDMIAVKGRIQTRTYETEEGQKRKVVEVVVDSVSFAGGKKGGGTQSDDATAKVDTPNMVEIADDDDLPF